MRVLLGKFKIQYVDTYFHGNDLMYTGKELSVKRTDLRALDFMRALPLEETKSVSQAPMARAKIIWTFRIVNHRK